MKSVALVGLLLILQPDPPPDTADLIMARVFTNIDASNQAKLVRMKFKKIRVIRNLKSNKIRLIGVYEVYGKDGVMIQKLVREKYNAERDSNENNERDLREDCASCKDINGSEETLGTDLNDPAFSQRFVFELIEIQQAHHLIKVTPKKNLQTRGDEDEAYNRLEGTILVDKEHFFIKNMRAQVKPFTKGFLVKVFRMREFNLYIEQGQIDNMIFTQQITVTMHYSILGSETHEQHNIFFKDFVILPPTQ